MNPALSEKLTVRVRPDESWKPLMRAAAHEVFLLMAGTGFESADFPPDSPLGEVSAMVGMAGSLCGVFRIRCSKEAAASIASKMPCGEEDAAQLCDAMAEICNMVAGNFKDKITGLSGGCMLSLPTVVVGEDYDVFSPSRDHVEVALKYEGSPVRLTLEISG
jgi:CheY-specific phosphatase CheX